MVKSQDSKRRMDIGNNGHVTYRRDADSNNRVKVRNFEAMEISEQVKEILKF
jgi:hypothetical protein